MTKLFGADTKEMKFLLSSIHNKERALPDFQRDFVWDARAIQDLLNSILRNFPSGSLLEIQQTSNLFRPREFEEAPAISEKQVPPFLILDGQQRLTSLYLALYGKGRHRFYLDIGSLYETAEGIPDEKPLYQELDIEDALFFETFRSYKGKIIVKENWPLEKQASELVFPLENVFGSKGGYEKWRDVITEKRKELGLLRENEKDILRRFGSELIGNLTHYHFPIITLQSNTPTEAVCTIFETLNRTGVKLSVFDLLVARFYPNKVNLREDWEEAKAAHSILVEFEIDPYYLLQIVALRCKRKGMNECKRSTVLKLDVEDYREYWSTSVEGMAEGLRLLRENCGVMTGKWLPYGTFVIPLSSIIAETMDEFKGADTIGWKAKLIRWFWASTFSQAYESAPNSVSKLHYGMVTKWLRDGTVPKLFMEAIKTIDELDISTITPRQRALYRGFMCIILKNGIRDFYKTETINHTKILSQEVNDHHIFPKGVFGKGEWIDIVDSIPNRTLIDEQSNKIIRDKKPSKYVPILKEKCKSPLLDDIFSDHFIQIGEGTPIWLDDLEKFLAARGSTLLNEARRLIGE